MGFFDKIKKFAGGAKTASVEVLMVNGDEPGAATISVRDGRATGSMRVTIQEDCTLLGTHYGVVLRTLGEEGEWSDATIADHKDEELVERKAGEVYEVDWAIEELEIAKYLGFQQWDDPNSAVGDERVKQVIRCTADVKGSPFDPEGEAEISLTEGSPVAVANGQVELFVRCIADPEGEADAAWAETRVALTS